MTDALADAVADPLPANKNDWKIDMERRVAVVRHRRTLEPVPVAIVVRIAELKALLAEVLHSEAIESGRVNGRLAPWAETKRRTAIVLRKEAQAELADIKAAPARLVVE